jgi:phosphatidate cytidylyltransferase
MRGDKGLTLEVSQAWLQFTALFGAAALLLGAVLVTLLWALPQTRSKIHGAAKNLLSTAVLFLSVCATLIWSELLALLVLCLVGGRVGWEISFALPALSKPLLSAMGVAAAVLPYLVFQEPAVFFLLWFAFLVIWLPLRRRKHALGFALLIHPVIPIMIISAAISDHELRPALLLAFVLGEIFDSFSFLSGRIFGRTKLAPVLSPSKTVEGSVGGAAMLVVLVLFGWAVFGGYGLWAVPAALTIAFFALAGDLWISRIKRIADIKDFPTLLDPQGGLLDSLDGWFFSAALFAVVSTALF